MIGNAAAEAHPIIGEGISMAMQSAWLLCERLIAARRANSSANALLHVGAGYARQWRQAFAPRLHLAATLAHLAMRPWLAPFIWPILGRDPRLMTAIARGAGKTRMAPSLQDGPPLRRFESLEDAN
jgi:flavin-dependent dehydrogenase